MERIFSNDRSHAQATPPFANILQLACGRNKGNHGQGQFHSHGHSLLIVNLQGFKSAEVPVKVGESKESPIRVPLQIAASAENVTVMADSVSIPTVGQNIDAVQLDRNWLENLPVRESDPLAVPSIFLDPAAAGALGLCALSQLSVIYVTYRRNDGTAWNWDRNGRRQ